MSKNRKKSKVKLDNVPLDMQRNLEIIKQHFSKIFMLQEEEKKRISRDLHDETGQVVVALGASLNIIERDIKEGSVQQALEKIEEVRELIKGLAAKMKIMAFNLRPPGLDILGLSAVFREFFAQCSESNPAIRIEFDENLKGVKLREDIEITLYRIVQEATYNIIKYADASLVKVNLILSQDSIQLIIEDDGKGFDYGKHTREAGITKMGLRGIKERVDILDGDLKITSSSGKGTKISVILPIA
ncbi:MAG: sensor histidine kinase [Candidatus Omnitrophica bacterium]|nr:sensor histidine kinase [Candidatus Omnitrophota bacterium]